MRIYIAGPMRGIAEHNYPAFDAAVKRWREAGHVAFSPAETDRALGYPSDAIPIRHVLHADLVCLMNADAIALLPGWEKSVGATCELSFAQALGLNIYDAVDMRPLNVPNKPWSQVLPTWLTPAERFRGKIISEADVGSVERSTFSDPDVPRQTVDDLKAAGVIEDGLDVLKRKVEKDMADKRGLVIELVESLFPGIKMYPAQIDAIVAMSTDPVLAVDALRKHSQNGHILRAEDRTRDLLKSISKSIEFLCCEGLGVPLDIVEKLEELAKAPKSASHEDGKHLNDTPKFDEQKVVDEAGDMYVDGLRILERQVLRETHENADPLLAEIVRNAEQ